MKNNCIAIKIQLSKRSAGNNKRIAATKISCNNHFNRGNHN